MKKCTTCRKRKPLSEFNNNARRTDGLQTFCRECGQRRSKQYYRENRDKHLKVVGARKRKALIRNQEWICEYLSSHPCVDCGKTDILVLDFDHRRRSRKEENISNAVRNVWSLKRIKREVAKCDIRCANCHRRKTAKQVKNYKLKYATGGVANVGLAPEF